MERLYAISSDRLESKVARAWTTCFTTGSIVKVDWRTSVRDRPNWFGWAPDRSGSVLHQEQHTVTKTVSNGTAYSQ